MPSLSIAFLYPIHTRIIGRRRIKKKNSRVEHPLTTIFFRCKKILASPSLSTISKAYQGAYYEQQANFLG
jgi:hypothetical protein